LREKGNAYLWALLTVEAAKLVNAQLSFMSIFFVCIIMHTVII